MGFKVFNQEKIKYLLVGGINTLAGYLIGVGLYKALCNDMNIFLIGAISNILSITVYFFNYKIFVFRTKGMWLLEYMKAYLIYSGTAIIGILLLWIFVHKMEMSIWLCQSLIMVCTVIISYIGHSRYTFRH